MLSDVETLLQSRIQQRTPDLPFHGTCVLYVMSRDQRLTDNYALYAAQLRARSLSVPLVVGFVLYPESHGRSKEHVAFMLEGLDQVVADLAQRNIPFVCKTASAIVGTKQLIEELTPAAVYFDFSPLVAPRARVQEITKSAKQPIFVVDAHNIVPLWVTSEKQEYAARTIRPKIHKHLDAYLNQTLPKLHSQDHPHIEGVSQGELSGLLSKLNYKTSCIVHDFQSGESAAQQALAAFIDERLAGYAKQRNDPSEDALSNLSPYLHFGQLSSRSAVLHVQAALAADSSLQQDVDAFIEEIVVRKELSDNFCNYTKSYRSLHGAPEWAQKTLRAHQDDPRQYIYTKEQLADADTHDPAWNAAQTELISTGKMHGYMRMYWAKKVLEWSPDAESALKILVQLNDFYSLDGGDPNGYTGVMWAVAGVHDRPWQERPIYGTVRSMVYNGLRRKFDVQNYIDKYTK